MTRSSPGDSPTATGRNTSATIARIVLSCLLAAALVVSYVVADMTDCFNGPLTLHPFARTPYPEPLIVPSVSRQLAGKIDRSRRIDPAQAQEVVDHFGANQFVGADFSVAIADAAGTIVAGHAIETVRQPASTLKTLTALAAASTLDMSSTLDTQTYLEQDHGDKATLRLKGNGDMLLGGAESDPDHVNGRAGLGTLAADTVTALKKLGISQVRLDYDDSLFADDRTPEGIEDNNPDNLYFTPPSSMAIDGGRIQTKDERTRNPDDIDSHSPLSTQTAKDCATSFAYLLKKQGITVVGQIGQSKAQPTDQPVASVSSASLSEIMAFMLRNSDNSLAEEFGRLTALASKATNSPAGAIQCIKDKLKHMNIDIEGLTMEDCSGLTPGSSVSVKTMVDVQTHNFHAGTAAAAAEGLSIPGLTGTATSRLADGSFAGQLRVKTGSLDHVTALVGNVSRTEGGVLSFAVIVNNPVDMEGSIKAVNDFSSSLAGL